MQRTAPPKPTEDNAAAKRAGLTGHKFNANTSNTRGKVSRPPMPKAGTNRSANKISAADIIQQKIQRRLEKVKKEDNDGKDRLPRDEEIQSAMITLISLDGTIEGIRPLSQVLNELDREQYTLMMVNAQEQPPACRVFSRKILYEREKQAKKQKKLASKSSSKPQIIQLNANIGDHDLGIKLKKTLGLLEKGKRVTIVIEKRSFNARKNDRVQEIAPVIMSQVEGHCSIVNSPSVEGTTWSVSLQGKAKTK
ncbi:hypothetical protein GGI12_004962 [Dipsacomyces acuminosporus]|nr:hypothetical protein GGI12_004962 [Dipsacomyces acuminosporus]